MNLQLNPVSESEALRSCNLPATPRWRNFLRTKLAFAESGAGKIYNSDDVDQLAAKIGDFARETARPGEQASNSTPIDSASSSRRKGELLNRLA